MNMLNLIVYELGEYSTDAHDFQKEIEIAEDKYHFINSFSSFIVKYSSKLRASFGTIKIKRNRDFAPRVTITLNKRFRQIYTFIEVLRTLRHELAHSIQYSKTGFLSHDLIFKEICCSLGGSMNENYAKGKYSSCVKDKPENADIKMKKYSYICPCGKVTLDRYNKIQVGRGIGRYACKYCETPVINFIVRENF